MRPQPMSRHTYVLTVRRGLPAAMPVTAAPNFSMFANAHAAFWTLVFGLWSLDCPRRAGCHIPVAEFQHAGRLG